MATKRNSSAFKAVILALSVSMSGCAYGLLYTSTTQPLVRNMRATPFGASTAAADTKQISLPVTALSLAAVWNSRAIGDAAKQAGLTEIYYADAHTLSLLLGLYEKKTIQVYGR